MKKKLIEIALPREAINKASAQEEIRVICYPPAPLDTEDLGRIWEFASNIMHMRSLAHFKPSVNSLMRGKKFSWILAMDRNG